MKNTQTKKQRQPSPKAKQARADLMALSHQAADYRKRQIAKAETEIEALAMASLTINSIVIGYYEADNKGAHTWHTFKQWKELGYSVKKGESAFYVWGAPRSSQKPQDDNKKDDEVSLNDLERKGEFWPLCCLFHNLQIEQIDDDTKKVAPTKNTTVEAQENKKATSTNTKLANKFRNLADRLTVQIESCFAERLTNTPKRLSQAENKRNEGRRLQRTQKALNALADQHEQGTINPILAALTTKGAIYALMASKQEPVSNGYHPYYTDTETPSNQSEQALALWALLTPQNAKEKAKQDIQIKINNVRFSKIAGYFPTPKPIIEQMIGEADIQDHHSICEPSAGDGQILDMLKSRNHATLEAFEYNNALAEILDDKGYTVNHTDFLSVEPQEKYDRILMNPPFEKLQDIEHIQHAYQFLKAGGCLVAICSPSGFFRSTKKAKAFQDWFAQYGVYEFDLPQGAFAQSGTQVSTKMIVIDKPECLAQRAESQPLGQLDLFESWL